MGQRRWLTRPRLAARALGGFRPSGALLGVVPFFAYVTVFLIIPTLVVVIGAFLSGGRPTLGNIARSSEPAVTRRCGTRWCCPP